MLFLRDLTPGCDPESASALVQGVGGPGSLLPHSPGRCTRFLVSPRNVKQLPRSSPAAGAVTNDYRGLWYQGTMCWGPAPTKTAHELTEAFLPQEALRMRFCFMFVPACMCLSFPCSEKGLLLWVSHKYPSKREKMGGKNHLANRNGMGQTAGKTGEQPGTLAGWQGVPLASSLPPISLGCRPHFCKGILGPGFKPQEEAGRAAAGHCGYPSRGAGTQTSLQGSETGWDMFLPVVFSKLGSPHI